MLLHMLDSSFHGWFIQNHNLGFLGETRKFRVSQPGSSGFTQNTCKLLISSKFSGFCHPNHFCPKNLIILSWFQILQMRKDLFFRGGAKIQMFPLEQGDPWDNFQEALCILMMSQLQKFRRRIVEIAATPLVMMGRKVMKIINLGAEKEWQIYER